MNLFSKFGMLAASTSLLLFAGCNSPSNGQNTWTIDGVDGPHLNYETNQMVIYATFKNLQIQGGATVPIPHMPSSTIELAPDVQTGALLMQATINAKDIANLAGTNFVSPQTLPGGRPLPGIAGGTLPALAVQVPALDNITFYLGGGVFGLFAPVKMGIDQAIGTFSYYDANNKHLGNISIVGEDINKQNSGFLLMINLGNAASVMAEKGLLDLR